MKKIFCFLAVAGTALFTSCNNDDDNNNNDATSITISSDNMTGVAGDTFTFTVRDNDNNDVTDDADIFVNNIEIEGDNFTADEPGVYEVHATMGDLESPTITITVTENPATSITVAVSSSTVTVGDEVTFTVITNDNIDVTEDATFFVNNIEQEGNTFTPEEAGPFTVRAEYMDLEDEATFTAEEEQTGDQNKILFNGEEYDVNGSALLFLGMINPDNPEGADTHAHWSIVTFEADEAGAPINGGNYIDIEFVTELDDEGNVVFPNGDNEEFYQVFEFFTGATEVEVTSNDSGNVNFTSEVDETSTTTAFTADAMINGTGTIDIDYEGDMIYQDISGGGSAGGNSSSKSLKKAKARFIK